MVSTFHALSVTIAAVFSGAGWVYYGSQNSTSPTAPLVHSVNITTSAQHQEHIARDFEFPIQAGLKAAIRDPIVQMQLTDSDLPKLRKGKWFILVPVISAALAVQKLPSFILVQDGHMHGSNISSPSLDGLLYIANADWTEFSEKSKKPIKEPTRHAVLNMKSFEVVGNMAYSSQRRIVAWINRDKIRAYITIGVILALIVFARRYGYLNIY
ncbi:hypothetical protein PSACC_02427 [Paramicrosporidium saccamoebae]|uniref:Uncharacterized protein n=1 Tax=Paramicrosporidium saccamoebae TaxID=1246581 RepID=A0A2H9TJ58_9FUNG|nr:hypothetical protein PSACC_02427 [Paramicrosporidium saccamoebae]